VNRAIIRLRLKSYSKDPERSNFQNFEFPEEFFDHAFTLRIIHFAGGLHDAKAKTVFAAS
jgi:hypothetical protein